MSGKPPPLDFDDNPEWTAGDFTHARPADEVMPATVVAALVKRRPGRPAGVTQPNAKRQVTLRLDPDVLDAFKADGPGWQSRINAALRLAAGV